MKSKEELSFSGTDRFRVLGRIGAGGMGVVYEVLDRTRNVHVALKTLLRLDPDTLYLFKQEFRSLTGISHPHLVTLYELFYEGQQWFFTMELVGGLNFIEFVSDNAGISAIDQDAPTAMDEDLKTLNSNRGARSFEKSPADYERLRPALAQLIDAVSALHAAGILHRDLKPGNVKVTPEGRVVVLDFGLAGHLLEQSFGQVNRRFQGGTAQYASPEQLSGELLTEASDWFSVGVMLYQALTGRFPFERAGLSRLFDQRNATAPAEGVSGIPNDLNLACVQLLSADPATRLQGLLALRTAVAADHHPEARSAVAKGPFVGRRQQLAVLDDAFSSVAAGQTTAASVYGQSGMGKTSMIEHFLEELSKQSDVVIIAGRCYEQESVPYKAFDSQVDALSRYLECLPPDEAASLIPRDAAALSQVFPVLRRVRAMAEAPGRVLEKADQIELRRRAFGALRELLAKLGDRHRLVLFIDDLQWADLDSTLLLKELLRPPDAPLFLLIAAYRSDGAAMTRWIGRTVIEDSGIRCCEIEVGPLSQEETTRLLQETLPEKDRSDALQEEIGRESGGSPYFVQELARQFQSGKTSKGEIQPTTLDAAIWDGVCALPDGARTLLRVIAVSGQPLRETEAYQAAQLGELDPKFMAMLRSARLVRGTVAGGASMIQSYHDRIRETVVSRLDAQTLKDIHLHLATSLASWEEDVPERIAIHYEGAGLAQRAAELYAVAAAQADSALAFNNAAKLLQQALRLGDFAENDRHELEGGLADALANAGRSVEAARLYQQAAKTALGSEVFRLERLAAYHFAISGHVVEGRRAFQQMLERVNLRLPGSPQRIILSLLVNQLRLNIRGYGFREQPEAQVALNQLHRIDVAWNASRGLGMIDVAAGASFNAKCLLLALRAGEIERVARSVIWDIGVASVRGAGGRRQIPKLIEICDSLVRRIDTPYLRGLLALAKGVAAYTLSSPTELLAHVDEAETIFTEECRGVTWEIGMSRMFALAGLSRFDLVEMGRRVTVILEDCMHRGDLLTALSIGPTSAVLGQLVLDRADAALDTLEESIGRCTHDAYQIQHALAAQYRVWVALYSGDGETALRSITRDWPLLKKNNYLRTEAFRAELMCARAQSALCVAASSAKPEGYVRQAIAAADFLEREQLEWIRMDGKVIRAGCDTISGNLEGAARNLEEATVFYDAFGLKVKAAATRLVLGKTIGGDRGRLLTAEADRWFQSQSVKNPARLSAVFVNGRFPGL